MRTISRMPAGIKTAMAAAGLTIRAWFLFLAAAFLLRFPSAVSGQRIQPADGSQSAMRQHYDAAFQFQSAGNLSQADSEYKLFLAAALNHIANGHANLGDYARAVPIYEEALRLAPDDRSLKMDYAGAALDASDWAKVKTLAASVLDTLKNNGQPPDPHAVSLLAKALLESGGHQEAVEQFKLAAQLQPGFDSSSQLAAAYLVLQDQANAAKILSEMPQKYGDTAILHMNLGLIYGTTGSLDGAVGEFSKAIEMDHSLKGAHYSLGATYLMQLGEPGYDKAEAEFRKEIAIDPDNSLVYTPLGRIAMGRHKYAEAETDLNRAVELNRQSADAYLYLGKLYRETGKIPQAEAAFRKSIALTLDPSKDEYAVEQAHFWLGRLLIQSGSTVEGRKELDISQNLLYLKEQRVQSRLAGKSTLQAPLEKTHEADPGDLAKQKAFEKEVGPPIASSYDNLGVNAANAGDLASASRYFEQAAQWNPALSDADRNWGRAAFAAKEYEKAVGPLSRTLALHPENPDVRSMLGLSLCMTHDYAQSLRVLQPIEASLGANPLLATAYAGSMAIAGDSGHGLARLKAIEEANPDKAFVHFVLGEVYASQKQSGLAGDELHLALKLDPSSADTKNALALTELALGQKADALQLFSELAEAGSKDGEVYRRLAQLQIELGLAKAAVDSLATAVRLDPMNATYHQELAEAYRKDGQPEAAEREDRQFETLHAESNFVQPTKGSNSENSNGSGASTKVQKN
jgi:tetratricopeptide (TPR) repeat protein